MARERLCLRATADYWINAMDGQPFLYVNKEVDPRLIATLKQDVIPWLEASVAKTAQQELRLAEDSRAHWFTMVFDREGYSPMSLTLPLSHCKPNPEPCARDWER